MSSSQLDSLIQAIDQADSANRLTEAVRQLAIARLVEAIPTLITILGYNNPGAAVAAVEGLVYLGEPAVEPLLNLLDDYNYGARAWSIRALAEIGDPRALDTLLNAVKTDFALSVRRSAAKGLGFLQWQSLSAQERRIRQQEVLEVLLTKGIQDFEWVVRYASVVGLQGLAAHLIEADDQTRILRHFTQIDQQDPVLAVSARAQLAYFEVSHSLSHPGRAGL
jgi:phycocyanobilin lyase beta subunit